MMNIESSLVKYLSGLLEAHVSADIPNPRPERLVTLERTGGGFDSIVFDRPQLSIFCWAPSRQEASELAYEVDRLIRDWDDPMIVELERSGLFNRPDSDGSPRYQITYEGITYL